jgi:small subunit ribosomal protein S24e
MKVEIDSKKENVLHKRIEVMFTAEHNGEATPKRNDLRASIADKLGVQKDRIVIDHTNSEFGMGKSHGYAKVYETAELAKKSEKNYILARQGMAEKKPKKVKQIKAKAAPKIK